MEIAIQTVVNNVWGKYDTDNSGELGKEEAMLFVQDSLGAMSGDKEKYKYSQEDFDGFFKELDADGSGTVDKPEMFRFVKMVCGLPVDTIVQKTPRTLDREKKDRFNARQEEERKLRLLAME